MVSAPHTPKPLDRKTFARQTLDANVGDITLRGHLELVSHRLSRDPHKAEASQVLAALNNAQSDLPRATADLQAAIPAAKTLMQAASNQRGSQEFNCCPLKLAHMKRGGAPDTENSETISQQGSVASGLALLSERMEKMTAMRASQGRGLS